MAGVLKWRHLHKWSKYFQQNTLPHSVLAPQAYQLMGGDGEPNNRKFSCCIKQSPSVVKKMDAGWLLQKQCLSPLPFHSQQRNITDILYCMSWLGYHCFNAVHYVSGQPWWLSIVLLVVPMRVGFQFVNEYIERENLFRLMEVKAYMLSSGVKDAKKYVDTQIGAQLPKQHQNSMKDQLNEIKQATFREKMIELEKAVMVENKCHPMIPLVTRLLHVPIWVSLTLSLREMVGLRFFHNEPREAIHTLNLSSEGVGWFQNLLLPDPLYILPVMTGLSFLLSTELQKLKLISMENQLPKKKLSEEQEEAKIRAAKRKLAWERTFKVGLVYMMIFTALLPSAVTFYWCFSTLTANLVSLLFLSPRVLRLCRLRPMPFDSKTPYKDIYRDLENSYNPFKGYRFILNKVVKQKPKTGRWARKERHSL